MKTCCLAFSNVSSRTRPSARSAILCDVFGGSIERRQLFRQDLQDEGLMNRRTFTKSLGSSVAAIGFGGVPTIARNIFSYFSITMDDFHWANPVKLTAVERNEAILGTLQANSIKAAAFVIGRNLESEEGKQVVTQWDNAGHVIGNHTYSHRNLNAPEGDVPAYQQDILRAEALLKEFPRFRKYFRFPMLKEGDTVAKRDAMRSFLAQNSYRTGHV